MIASPFCVVSCMCCLWFGAAQILDGAIQTRWKILPQDQRDGIKTYVVGKIIQVCACVSCVSQMWWSVCIYCTLR